jgi:hypothetical protein
MALLPALALIAISTPVLLFALSRIEPARGVEADGQAEPPPGALAHLFDWGRALPHLLVWIGVAVGSLVLLFLFR